MPQPLHYLRETASQTAGPYVHIGLIPRAAGFEMFETEFGSKVAPEGMPGERIVLQGRVIDGTGATVRDALLELWQADGEGRHAHPADPRHGEVHPGFRGWGRAGTDFETGLYRFETIKPGRVKGRGGRLMAPHVSLWIVARGINIGLQTRAYFSDETEANAADPVLAMIEQEARRGTLIARREPGGDTPVYTFDIRLQGEDETVFFDI